MSTISNSWPKLSDTQEFMNDMGNVWGFHHSGTFDSNSFHFVMRFIRLTWYFFRVWNLKKKVPKYGFQKAGSKKQGHCYSKEEEEAAWPLLFLDDNDPAFCNPYFGPDYFQGHKLTHVFKTRIVGADWRGQCGGECDYIPQCIVIH